MVQRVVGKGRVETPLSLQLLEHLECRFLGCDEHVVAARKPSSEGSKHVNTHVTLKSLFAQENLKTVPSPEPIERTRSMFVIPVLPALPPHPPPSP